MAFVNSICVSPRVAFRVPLSVSSFNGRRAWTAPVSRAATIMNLDTIQVAIDKEMANAKEATAKFGKNSKEAALAWDVVEELEAEASHLKAAQGGPKDPLDELCAESPEADECRVYES